MPTLFGRNLNFHDSEGAIQPIGAWSDQGLEFLFLLTGSLSRAVKNRANMKPDGAFGAVLPAIGANYLTFAGNVSWLLSQMVDSPEFTFAVVANWTSQAGFTPLVTTNSSDSPAHPGHTSNGAQLYASPTSASLALGAAYWTGATDVDGGVSLATAGFSIFNFMIGKGGAGGGKARNMTSGTSATYSQSGTRDPTSQPVRIGSTSSSNMVGTSNIALVAGWSRQTADSEDPAFYAQMQGYLGGQGITV